MMALLLLGLVRAVVRAASAITLARLVDLNAWICAHFKASKLA